MRTLLLLGLLCVAGCGGARPEPTHQGISATIWVDKLLAHDVAEQERAADVLTVMGPEILPYLKRPFERDADTSQAYARSVCYKIGEPAVPFLEHYLNSGTATQKLEAASAIAGIAVDGAKVDAVLPRGSTRRTSVVATLKAHASEPGIGQEAAKYLGQLR